MPGNFNPSAGTFQQTIQSLLTAAPPAEALLVTADPFFNDHRSDVASSAVVVPMMPTSSGPELRAGYWAQSDYHNSGGCSASTRNDRLLEEEGITRSEMFRMLLERGLKASR